MECHQAAFDDFCQDEPLCEPSMHALFMEHRDEFDAKAKEITRQVRL
jgi:hypothetical protein